MPYAKDTSQAVESRRETSDEQQIRAGVEAANKGTSLVIDIETGEYEIDEDDLVATRHLLARPPDAVVYGLRIGFPSAYRLRGRSAAVEAVGGGCHSG